MSAGRRLLAVADALPVTMLALIAGEGSFTHIRDTAAEHGQGGPMSWAVAVCVDLTCVMAARERQRDEQAGIPERRLSWPAAVLAGGVLLSLAANMPQAQWLDRRRAQSGVAPVVGLMLDGPWLDLQVYPAARHAVLTQALRVLARVPPFRSMRQRPGVYGSTLHTSCTGEWLFDLGLKPLTGFPAAFGWLNVVRRGQIRLHRGVDVGVPSLVLRSDRTDLSRRYSDLSDCADLVLGVEQIGRRFSCLGQGNKVVTIQGARRDVFLSVPEVRDRLRRRWRVA